MKTLKTSGALIGDGVCLNYHKTLEKVLGSDQDVSVPQNGNGAAKVIENTDFVSHALDTEKRVSGALTNGENCSEFGEICKGFPKYEGKGLNDIVSSRLNGVDSVNVLEVSGKDGNGISLFVDVFNPLEVFDLPRDSNSVVAERNPNFNENGTVCHGSVENTSIIVVETKQELDTSEQECKFSNGDFVWAKFKTQLWWPGQICDPSTASIFASRTLKELFVIRNFGDGSYVQWSSQKLKPFAEYFEQMSKQSSSRSFREAIDKAINELGMHAKTAMTCSCFPIETETQSAAKEKQGEISKFGLNKFEPVNFLAYLKDFSNGVLAPNVIDSIVVQSQLSAYHRAMGHRQLSIDQLLPVSDMANDKANIDSKPVDRKVGTGYKLRDRCKNLPLVVATHLEIEKDNTGRKLEGPNSTIKPLGEKSKKKRPEKPITEESSAKMVSELRFTALNCLYPHKSKRFDVVFRYFSGFRKFSFIKKERRVDYTAVNPVIIDFGNAGPVNREAKSLSNKRKKAEAASASNIGDITTSGSVVIDFMKMGPTPASQPVPRKKRKTVILGSLPATHTGDSLPGLNLNVATNNHVILDFQNNLPFSLQGQVIPKDATENAERTPASLPATRTGDGLSGLNLNGATNGSVILDIQNNLLSLPQGQVIPKKATENAERTPASLPTTHTGDGLSGLNVNGATNGPVILDIQTNVLSLPQGQVMPKKATENAERTPASLPATQSGDCLLGFNVNAATTGPVILDFQKNVRILQQGQVTPKNVADNAERTPVHPHIEEISDAFSNLHFKKFAATRGKIELKKRKKKEASIEIKDVDSKSSVVLPDIKGSRAKFVPVLNNLQPKSIPKESALLDINFEVDGNNVGPVLLESKELKMNEKNSECASLLPDLNEITPEPISNDSVMAKYKPRKRSKVASNNEVFDINSDSANKMGTALLLKFADEFPLPSVETLVSTFSGFGQVLQSETIASSESCSAQVVFTRSCDARDAFINLTKCSPFGPALVNYRLHDLSLPNDGNNNDKMRGPVLLAIDKPVKQRAPRKPRVPTQAKAEALVVRTVPARTAFGLTGPQNKAGGDVLFMRQKLEMMTSMMEKAGDKLAPQMRARLEGEINGLMNKIRTMSASS